MEISNQFQVKLTICKTSQNDLKWKHKTVAPWVNSARTWLLRIGASSTLLITSSIRSSYLHPHRQFLIILSFKNTARLQYSEEIGRCWLLIDNSCVKVLEVLCSLCVCDGVAVRSNQNLICDNLLPGRDILLQTALVEQVCRYFRRGCSDARRNFSLIRLDSGHFLKNG